MKTLTSIAFALASTLVAAQTVVMNGRTVSTHVRSINGAPYVSLRDMASALGLTVARKGNSYVLVAAGGANQIRGKREGRIGDHLFTGDWGFTVLSVKEHQSYIHRFGAQQTIEVERPGDKLVVVTCRLKNGHGKPENMNFTNQFGPNSHSSLTDADGHSFPVKDYDVHYTYYNWGAEALPGASIDFALVFETPADAHPQDLVYSIYRYEDRGNSSKTTDVRVHMSKP